MEQSEQKLVLIVGMGAGLGMELARRFGTNGYAVVLAARSMETLTALAGSLHARGIEAFPVRMDVADEASVTEAFGQIDRLPGRVCGLLYNAVARRTKTPSRLTVPEVEEDLKVNLLGAVACVSQVLARWKDGTDGFILFTGGGVALTPSLAAASMSLGKAALRNYALNLAEELKQSPVFVGTVTITRKMLPGTECDPAAVAERYFSMLGERTNREIIL